MYSRALLGGAGSSTTVETGDVVMSGTVKSALDDQSHIAQLVQFLQYIGKTKVPLAAAW